MKIINVRHYVKLELNGDILAALVVFSESETLEKLKKHEKPYRKVTNRGLHVLK